MGGMKEIILGNITSILACGSESFSATRKTNKEVLLVQCLSQIFFGAGYILLKGYSGLVQNVVAIARNLFAAFGKSNKIIEWTLILSAAVLGVIFNNRGLLGILPVAGNLLYSIAIFRFKDSSKNLKIAFGISSATYVIYNAAILNFVGAIMSLIVVISVVINLVKKNYN